MQRYNDGTPHLPMEPRDGDMIFVPTPLFDPVHKPAHYNQGKFECIDVIEDWKLGYNLGCVLKYICRSDHKGSRKQDLEKAMFYLQREIDRS